MVTVQPVLGTTDDTTVSMNNLRTGWDADQPGLTPEKVSAADFGRLFTTTVDGQIYAQPLVVGTTVVVATETNSVYGIHGVTGAIQWHRTLGPPFPFDAVSNCKDLKPSIGITSTPVYDPSTGLVHLTTKVNDGPDTKHPHWYLHALDLATGADHPGWPVTIQGAPANNPANAFDPYTAHQRPGLLLLDGEVFAGFGSHCDRGSYVGYVVGVHTTTRAIRMWATEDATSGADAGVWMSGGGLVSDGPGRIFFSTGNGISPAPGPGHPAPGNLAESVVRLGTAGTGPLTAQDFFSPSDADNLDAIDQDLGSGGPVALPSPPFAGADHPHLMVHVGKDGRVFLLDRDDLGGRAQGPGGTDRVLGVTGPFRGVWGHPAVWGGGSGRVYVAENDGQLRAYAFGLSDLQEPELTPVGASSAGIGHYPGSPVVTSTGTQPGSALVWVICPGGPLDDNSLCTDAQLRAYDAEPEDGVLRLRWSAPIGNSTKFSVPAVGGGRVYVGTGDGRLIAFGRPSGSPLTGSFVDLGSVGVGSSGQATATVTASDTVTVTAVTTEPPFSLPSPPQLPATLHPAEQFAVPVSFTPTGPGGAVGSLSFSTSVGGTTETVGLGVFGNGTKPGFSASPSVVTFDPADALNVGDRMTLGVIITNTGTTADTISTTGVPAAPFHTGDLPQAVLLQPGASLAIAVTYAPTTPSPPAGDTDRLTVTGASGLSVTVPLRGRAVVGDRKISVTPLNLDFGQVPVGGSRTLDFHVRNSGTLTLTLTLAKAPTPPFNDPHPLAEGQRLGPESDLHPAVVFAPTATGPANGQYTINSDSKHPIGKQIVNLTGTGVPGGAVPGPARDSWSFNGSAALSGADLVLTRAAPNETGSALHTVAVPTAGLRAEFSVEIGGGTGADGLAFVLLDPTATPQALGAGGGGLGCSGLPGIAVTLDTHRNTNDPSANFLAIATGGTGDALTYASTATGIPDLRTGTHDVHVTVANGHLQVDLDHVRVLDTAVRVPTPALVGFTAATAALTDIHLVRNTAIVC
ncbi:choice-of-anchor D domain-containing protein [Streptomyces sp. NPDC001851]|uniref:choice-of-anchor D domain-containing protein n=1 Tax=Streptomyces sp. NPDC001851 TaxID=3154529 RepID=UPI00331CD385